MINKKTGERIRQMRKDWGLSQIELAEKIGISFQQIQKYEKGITNISVKRVSQISEALGIDIGTFFNINKEVFELKDSHTEYRPEGKTIKMFFPPNKEERLLLKSFRKIKNKKLRESILKYVQGILELEKH